MFLIVLAVIALLVAFGLQASEKTKNISRILKVISVVILLVGVLTACIVQIQAGEVGVATLFGKVSDNILNSGLNFVNPFVVVKRFDVRTENYTMSGVSDEGDQQGDDAIRVLTSDGLELTLDVSV